MFTNNKKNINSKDKNEDGNKLNSLNCKNLRSTIFKATINAKNRQNLDDVTTAIKTLTATENTDSTAKGNKSKKQREKSKWNQENPRLREPYLNNEVEKLYANPANEMNFLDGLGVKEGNPRSKIYIERPTKVQTIFNMRTRNVPLFTLTENPKEVNCSVGKKSIKISDSQTKFQKPIVPKIIEELDYKNPFNLDFQGFDWKETYNRDEQIEQNKREYFKQKNNYSKKEFMKQKTYETIDDNRQKSFGLPDFFKIQGEPLENHETISNVDLNVPVFERPEPEAIPFIPESKVQAQLIRTTDKPKNLKIINEQFRIRQKQVENRFQKKTKKEQILMTKNLEKDQNNRDNYVLNLGLEQVSDSNDKNKELQDKVENLPSIYKGKTYPHTMNELKYYKRVMNRKNREIKNYAALKTDFYRKIGKDKIFKEKDIQADENSNNADPPMNEQSTDDEDGLSVGPKISNQYQLRGFKSKLNREPRGLIGAKAKLKEDHVQQTCATRGEWLETVAPKKKNPIIFKNCPSTIIPRTVPTDDDFSILTKTTIHPNPIGVSPIIEMINNLLPVQSKCKIEENNPVFVRPKNIKIKKFNLTGYLYGSVKHEKDDFESQLKKIKRKGLNKMGVPLEMVDRRNVEFDRNQTIIKQRNKQRLIAIGAEEKHIEENNGSLNNKIIDVISENASETESNSDWIPDKNEQINDSSSDDSQSQKEIHSLTNIKAPKFRESTIRHHPRQFRERASIDIDKNQHVPRIMKIDSDIVIRSNLKIPKTKYSKILGVRHHHDHLDHSQHKEIKVMYMPKIPKDKNENSNQQLIEPTFYDYKTEFSFPQPPESVIHTRHPTEFKNTPNKINFHKYIHDKFLKFRSQIGVDSNSTKIDPDLLKQFEEEIRSIESCFTSDTSSNGTNFTNDSGSFLLIQDKKVPIAYLTKSCVPFEEVDRTRITADRLTDMNEEKNPYYRVPFCGQRQLMRKIVQPQDKFFTSAVRSRFGIRERLKVHLPEYNDELLGELF